MAGGQSGLIREDLESSSEVTWKTSKCNSTSVELEGPRNRTSRPENPALVGAFRANLFPQADFDVDYVRPNLHVFFHR